VRARWGARPQPYRSIAFAPDGRTIACGSAHGAVDVWDVTDPRRHALVRSHIGLARELKFVDAVTLGSAGSDGVVRLWEGGRRVERGEALGEAQVASVAQTLFYAPEGPALRAVLRLAAVPDDAIPQLRAALRPGRPPAGEVVARYLVALDSDRFVTRAAAARALEDLGPLALPALNKALDVPMTLETRRRLQQIIGRLEERVRAESSRLFGLRSVLVLERIGSAAALGLLKEMSTGVPDEAVQREAQQALARLR
jgi:HEAT repeat protein